ncbi:hypothetical protein EJB05_29352, partial [Eragrostis curvula]
MTRACCGCSVSSSAWPSSSASSRSSSTSFSARRTRASTSKTPPSSSSTLPTSPACSPRRSSRVGVYYDRLDVYASYKYQQVTLGASLPPVYQGHGDVDVWSPVLTGPNVPFAPYLADALGKDVANGYLIMEVKIDGRVRWKVGSWTSGHYHIFVTCPAFFITSGGNGVVGAGGLRFQTATYCHVETTSLKLPPFAVPPSRAAKRT